MSINNRIYFLDALRSVLMMLGVVLHSAQVYNPEKTWLIYSASSLDFAESLVHFIHVFRMPTFFIISGFFCTLSLKKYSAFEFLKVRLLRILIPLISTALTLNVIQFIILSKIKVADFDIGAYILDGEWVSHLWFLNNLIFYFLIAASIKAVLPNKIVKIVKLWVEKFFSIPKNILLIILPFTSYFVYALSAVRFPVYESIGNAVSLYHLFDYMPYFTVGILLGFKTEYLYKFVSTTPWFSLATIISCILILRTELIPEGIANVLIVRYLEALIMWQCINILFLLFNRFFAKASKTWYFLSDASYSIYLFHHLLIIVFGSQIIKTEIHPFFGLFILILVTTISTLLIHKYIILKIPMMRFLFNGK